MYICILGYCATSGNLNLTNKSFCTCSSLEVLTGICFCSGCMRRQEFVMLSCPVLYNVVIVGILTDQIQKLRKWRVVFAFEAECVKETNSFVIIAGNK